MHVHAVVYFAAFSLENLDHNVNAVAWQPHKVGRLERPNVQDKKVHVSQGALYDVNGRLKDTMLVVAAHSPKCGCRLAWLSSVNQ